MTEREKMPTGRLYDANHDAELLALREACQERCYDYNRLRPSQAPERDALLRRLFGTTGDDCLVLPPLYCDYGTNVHVGCHFFANFGLTLLDEAPIRFGDHVFIGPHCGFYTAGHPLDAARRNAGLEFALPITVGNNVWFGAHVCVLPGVRIGNDVVVGAGSVVTKDLPDGVIAAGNPCRILRKAPTAPAAGMEEG